MASGPAPTLTIAVAQPALTSCDVAANARAHAEAVRSAQARVVVFPELSLTGYELDAPAIGVSDDRLRPIVEACAETGSMALVGAPVATDGDAEYIALLAIHGDGVSVAYRKVWLGDNEATRFTPGSGPAVLEVDGWRLGLAICRDTGIARARVGHRGARDRRLPRRHRQARGRGDPPARAGPPDRGRARRLGRDRKLRGLDRRRVHGRRPEVRRSGRRAAGRSACWTRSRAGSAARRWRGREKAGPRDRARDRRARPRAGAGLRRGAFAFGRGRRRYAQRGRGSGPRRRATGWRS